MEEPYMKVADGISGGGVLPGPEPHMKKKYERMRITPLGIDAGSFIVPCGAMEDLHRVSDMTGMACTDLPMAD